MPQLSVPQLSVAENIFLGREPLTRTGLIDFDAMIAQATVLMDDLRMRHINVARPARALNKDARLLIPDEPTSSLTRRDIDTLLDLVRDRRRRGAACVYIPHKLDEIEAIADSVTVLRDVAFVGSAPMAQLTRGDIIRMMVGREMNLFPREPHDIGAVVFEARHITCWDSDNRQRKRVDDVSFSVRAGEILGVAGLVGAGRTELVSALFGAWRRTSEGSLFLDGKPLRVRSPVDAVRAGIFCMVPEDRKAHGIIPGMGVGQNMTMAVPGQYVHGGLIDGEAGLRAIVVDIARMRIKTASPILPISNLSGGNQQKAVIARMPAPALKLLILDEPTRGVDVGARYEIYRLIFALARTVAAVIMVSSEMPELLGIADRVLVIGDGELRGDFVNDGLTQEQVLSAAITPLRRAA